MARILLIHPDNEYNKIGFSLSLGSIGGALAGAGHVVSYLLMYLYWNKGINIVECLKGNDIVGITVSSCDFDNAIKLARLIKNLNRNIYLLAGGPHATFDPESLLNEGYDICVRGEGEITVVDAVDCLAEHRNLDKLSGIAGISYKTRHGEIRHVYDRQYNPELDSLALPDWHQDDYRRILKETYLPAYDATSGMLNNKVIAFMVESSRGCPYKCVFCTTSKIKGKQWRSKTSARILTEINHFIDFCTREYAEMPLHCCFLIQFPDDNFCFDIGRVTGLCEAIAAYKGKRVYWTVMARAGEMTNKSLIKKMKDAGCVRIFIGAECGYESGLARIKKGITLSMISKSLDSLVGAKIPFVIVSWIIGFPWEKRVDCMKTIWRAMKMAQKDPNRIRSSIFTFSPLVGSDIAREMGVYVRGAHADHARDDTWGFGHPNMTNADLYELRLISNYLVFLHNKAREISTNGRTANKSLLANSGMRLIQFGRVSDNETLLFLQRINALLSKIGTARRFRYSEYRRQLTAIVDLLREIIKKESLNDVPFLS